jgi:hypothetical protein
MVKENGVIIAMKNINQEELDSAERVLIGEKLEIKEIVEINIPDLSPRQLIVIGRI